MLEKTVELNSYTIQSDGVCFVELYNVILEDGLVISKSKHRDVYYPSTVIPQTGYSEVDALLKAKWTSAVVINYEEKMRD